MPTFIFKLSVGIIDYCVFLCLSPQKLSRKKPYNFDTDTYSTYKKIKSLKNQGFGIKNKNYNLGTYCIKVIVLIWSE